MNSIAELSKSELLRLMQEYNEYVMNYEENSEGYPVCLEEFYDNEYQYILYVGDKIRFDDVTFLNEDLHKWLLDNKAINYTVVEVDNEEEVFYIETVKKVNNCYIKVRCPYSISLYESYRRILNNEKEYIVEIDNDYGENINNDFDDTVERLKKLVNSGADDEEIEDFIYSYFSVVDIRCINIGGVI